MSFLVFNVLNIHNYLKLQLLKYIFYTLFLYTCFIVTFMCFKCIMFMATKMYCLYCHSWTTPMLRAQPSYNLEFNYPIMYKFTINFNPFLYKDSTCVCVFSTLGASNSNLLLLLSFLSFL